MKTFFLCAVQDSFTEIISLLRNYGIMISFMLPFPVMAFSGEEKNVFRRLLRWGLFGVIFADDGDVDSTVCTLKISTALFGLIL